MTSTVWSRLALAALLAAAAPAAADEGAVERGRYVFQAANCLSCHTERGGAPLAGGRAVETPFGTFYGTNITPDPETGIGGWSAEDFARALRRGVAPDGAHYFPAFPYTSFAAISDPDLADLWAYLRTVEPVRRANRPHEVDAPFRWRWLLAPWKWLNFDGSRFVTDPQQSSEWNRGRYLVEVLGHCDECHTPRGRLGAQRADMAMAGTSAGDGVRPAPNITPDSDTGIGRWSRGDLDFFLETGFMPDGDVVGGVMGEVIANSTRRLTPADRAAMVEYLMALPPVHHRIERRKKAD